MVEDQTIICKDCGNNFTWTAEEQAYYAEKGFQNVPTRCIDCRKKSRDNREASKPKFEITCQNCKKKEIVPFEPIPNQPIYCSECFDKMRSSNN